MRMTECFHQNVQSVPRLKCWSSRQPVISLLVSSCYYILGLAGQTSKQSFSLPYSEGASAASVILVHKAREPHTFRKNTSVSQSKGWYIVCLFFCSLKAKGIEPSCDTLQELRYFYVRSGSNHNLPRVDYKDFFRSMPIVQRSDIQECK